MGRPTAQRAAPATAPSSLVGAFPDEPPVGLFAPGGALERFPGAVLLVGSEHAVLGANGPAEPIADLLRAGPPDDLRTAIAAAVGGTAAQVNPLLIPGEGDRGCADKAFDAVLLPWGNGDGALILARDITLERSLRAALIESRQRFKDLVEAGSDLIWETDAAGRFTYLSAPAGSDDDWAGCIGTAADDLLIDPVPGAESPFRARGRMRSVELWIRAPGGADACMLATAVPLFGADGAWRGARGTCLDVTAERSSTARLAVDRHRERLLKYILGVLRDDMEPARMLSAACAALVPALDVAGAAIYRREGAGALVNAAEAGALPAPERVIALTARAIEESAELEDARSDGSLTAMPTRVEQECNGVLCLWRHGHAESWGAEDRSLIAEIAAQIGFTNHQLARRQVLEQLSSCDPLTGLLNRRSFMAELERRHSRRGDWRDGAALFFVDMDNFKAVNDRHGHQCGDRALVALSRILRDETRSRDLVARLGGDEFALFVEDVAPVAAQHQGERLLRAAAQLRAFSGGDDQPLGVSLGIAFCPPDGAEDVAALIDRADRAMYAVKRQGKGALVLDAGDDVGAAP